MTSLKEVLDSLAPKDRQLLMYAFENSLEQYIALPEGRYIAVHAHRASNLIPDLALCSGAWSVGTIKKPKIQ